MLSLLPIITGISLIVNNFQYPKIKLRPTGLVPLLDNTRRSQAKSWVEIIATSILLYYSYCPVQCYRPARTVRLLLKNWLPLRPVGPR
jgi:hypothetical protein